MFFFCLERIFFSILRPVIVFTSSSFREIAVCFMTILPFHRRVMFLLSLTKNVAHAVDMVSKEREKDADQWLPHRDSGKISSLLLENVPILLSWAWGAKNTRINLSDVCVCVCVVCVGILRRSKTIAIGPAVLQEDFDRCCLLLLRIRLKPSGERSWMASNKSLLCCAWCESQMEIVYESQSEWSSLVRITFPRLISGQAT